MKFVVSVTVIVAALIAWRAFKAWQRARYYRENEEMFGVDK